MTAHLSRFVVLNLIFLAGCGVAWVEDFLFLPFTADQSRMSWLILAVFLWGVIAVALKAWPTVRWAGNALVYLGMVGTVLGLIMTVNQLGSADASSFDDFKHIVTAIYIGSGTALYTNLLACIGYLWLGTLAHLLAKVEV